MSAGGLPARTGPPGQDGFSDRNAGHDPGALDERAVLSSQAALPDREALRRIGVTLRCAVDADLAFLRALYIGTRADELARLAWTDAEKTAFGERQFVLQHRHFLAHHGGGDFLIVQHRGQRAGRLYLDRTSSMWRIVDIAIDPGLQCRGLGRALLRWVQHAARRGGAEGVDLHVARDNSRAARLYAALGFVEAITAYPTHRRMLWRDVRGRQTERSHAK